MTAQVTERKPPKQSPWNRCDACGKFILLAAFDAGEATRRLVTQDTAFSSETYETLCREHKGR